MFKPAPRYRVHARAWGLMETRRLMSIIAQLSRDIEALAHSLFNSQEAN